MIKTIAIDNAPAAIGPYSQGKIAGDFIYVAGQLAIDPATGDMVGTDVQAQAEQVIKNVAAILEGGGATLEDVVKTTCFLADIADFAAFNEVYAKYFVGKPARSCFAVKDLPREGICEIEAIAYIGK